MNNYDNIEPLLDFSDPELFYYLQILRRKKDNPDQKHVKVIRDFYIGGREYWDSIKPSVINLCDKFNARAYLRLNRRSWEQVALSMFSIMGEYARSKNWEAFRGAYSKACGRYHKEDPRIWVIDVDGGMEQLNLVTAYIQELQQVIKKDYEIIDVLQTKNGYHVLSHPFNVQKFSERFPDVEIHRDNPTLLYMP